MKILKGKKNEKEREPKRKEEENEQKGREEKRRNPLIVYLIECGVLVNWFIYG